MFVWLSENSGGYGLAGIGVLLFTNECTVPKKNGNGTHPGLLLNVFMLSTRVFEPLNQSVITELSEDAPLGIREEARAHSLNGIKQIDEQSAEFIRLRFTQG